MEINTLSSCIVTNWAGGRTNEYVISPKGSSVAEQNFDFRISTATVELASSNFTPFVGYHRFLMVLEGELIIHHEGQYTKQLKPLDFDLFSGDWISTSKGKVVDFNVIYKRDLTFDFKLIEFNEVNQIALVKDFEFIFLLQGAIQINELKIDAGTLIQKCRDTMTFLLSTKLLVFNITK